MSAKRIRNTASTWAVVQLPNWSQMTWVAPHHAQIVVVFILRYDREPIQPGMLPNSIITRAIQARRLDMAGGGKQVGQAVDQLG